MQVDPKNTAIQPVLRRLNPIIQQKVRYTIRMYVNNNICKKIRLDSIEYKRKNVYTYAGHPTPSPLMMYRLHLLSCITYLQVEQHSSTENKVKQMFDLAFNEKESADRRKQVHNVYSLNQLYARMFISTVFWPWLFGTVFHIEKHLCPLEAVK